MGTGAAAAHATVSGARLRLDGLIASLSGDEVIQAHAEGDAIDAAAIGASLAEVLRAKGGEPLLKNLG
ncbi:MAG: hypothetical protein WKF30_06275 [Pyrinomonadaceae bacterium]